MIASGTIILQDLHNITTKQQLQQYENEKNIDMKHGLLYQLHILRDGFSDRKWARILRWCLNHQKISH